MKKNIYKILLFLIILFPINVYAAPTGSTSCSSSGTVSLNNTITVTVRGSSSDVMWDTMLSYDSSKLQYISGSGARNISDSFSTSMTYSYTFRAIGLGSAYVKTNTTVSDYYGEKNSFSSSCNINVVNPSSGGSSSGGSSSNNRNNRNNKNNNSNVNKSSDNNLKSLGIEGVTLTPEFNKDTLEYSVELESNTTKVKVNAEKNDSKASISGTGEKEVVEGNNKLEIVVTAENGSSKTYVINALVKEKNPIVVKIKNDKYTVVRKKDVIEAPQGYKETTVVINDEEIPAYSNEVTGYLLVGLTDSDGKSSWYIYDKDKKSYTKYIELSSSTLRLIILNPKKEDIPYKYKKDKFEFNGQMIEGYAFDKESDFRLIYAMNIETGDKLFYLYDIKDKTLQRYYNEQVSIYIKLVKKCKYLIIGMATGCALLFILLISSLVRNSKNKKKCLSKVSKPVIKNREEIEYKDIEATKVLDEVNENKVKQDKKELKKQIKEDKKRIKKEEKKLKKEGKAFLDE